MKVVIPTSTFPSSPTDPVPRFVEDQVKEFAKLDTDLEMHVLIPHNSYGDPVANVVEQDTHTEHRYHYAWPNSLEKLTGRAILPALRQNPLRYLLIPGLLLSQQRAMMKLCRQVQPDVIYCHWFMPQAINGYRVSKKLGIPLVFTTHAADVSVLKKVPMSHKLVARVLEHAYRYTAVSRRTASKLEAAVDPKLWKSQFKKKLEILPMGTHLKEQTGGSDGHKKVLKKHGVNTDEKNIFCIGRISEKKGFKYLVEAYSKLSTKQQAEYGLVIAGDGELLDNLKAQVKDLGIEDRVTFTGYVQGELKDALFAEADVFAMPSIVEGGDSEGLPVALMEALSARKLVIATNVSGAEEIIDEKSGFLINQKSSDEIVDALQRIMKLSNDKRDSIADAGYKLAKQFDWPLVAEQHLKILRKAAKS